MNARSQRFVSSSWCRPGILVALLSASSLAIPVQSQEPRTTVREAVTVAGTVDRIDQLSRALTLRTSAGAVYTINVAPELTLFDELKRGDTLTVRLYESVIVAVRPDVKPSIAVDTTASANQRETSGRVAKCSSSSKPPFSARQRAPTRHGDRPDQTRQVPVDQRPRSQFHLRSWTRRSIRSWIPSHSAGRRHRTIRRLISSPFRRTAATPFCRCVGRYP